MIFVTVRWPKMAPRCPQYGPKMASIWPPDGHKMANMGPRGFKMASGGPFFPEPIRCQLQMRALADAPLAHRDRDPCRSGRLQNGPERDPRKPGESRGARIKVSADCLVGVRGMPERLFFPGRVWNGGRLRIHVSAATRPDPARPGPTTRPAISTTAFLHGESRI